MVRVVNRPNTRKRKRRKKKRAQTPSTRNISRPIRSISMKNTMKPRKKSIMNQNMKSINMLRKRSKKLVNQVRKSIKMRNHPKKVTDELGKPVVED